MNTAQSYRNLPPLAGLGSLADAMKPGLSVEESVRRLKRHHYAFKRLHQIFTARLTAEPEGSESQLRLLLDERRGPFPCQTVLRAKRAAGESPIRCRRSRLTRRGSALPRHRRQQR